MLYTNKAQSQHARKARPRKPAHQTGSLYGCSHEHTLARIQRDPRACVRVCVPAFIIVSIFSDIVHDMYLICAHTHAQHQTILIHCGTPQREQSTNCAESVRNISSGLTLCDQVLETTMDGRRWIKHCQPENTVVVLCWRRLRRTAPRAVLACCRSARSMLWRRSEQVLVG